jgi:small subunit ribosomal protein S12
MSHGQRFCFPGPSTKRQRVVAGVKATERAISSGEAERVLIARDAESRVLESLLKLCKDKGIEVEYVDSMKELGALAGIRVGAAASAILECRKQL